MEVLYLACCFSPFMYQNATLSIWMGQIQQKCTHSYITNFERLKPILAPSWNLKTHMQWYNSVLQVLIPRPLGQPGRPWGQRSQGSPLQSASYLSSPMCLTIMIISQVGYEMKKNRKLCLRQIRSAKNQGDRGQLTFQHFRYTLKLTHRE